MKLPQFLGFLKDELAELLNAWLEFHNEEEVGIEETKEVRVEDKEIAKEGDYVPDQVDDPEDIEGIPRLKAYLLLFLLVMMYY